MKAKQQSKQASQQSRERSVVNSSIDRQDKQKYSKAVYDHKTVESVWTATWNRLRINTFDVRSAKKPFYNLMMFPYPSAEGLHVGNMYAFTGSDVYGRYKRLQGYDVFEPIGLDGFGIHSENYALKIGRHPMDHAAITEKNYYKQLSKIGSMYDWSRSLETYDSGYYRWTQWLFVRMFKEGLAYRKKASVNFCPSCKTVLADEQVIDGLCERCGNTVEKRLLEQWFFRITAYAENLLENISALDWSEKVKIAQTNWIGKKDGIDIYYKIVNRDNREVGSIACFTTHPDTNFGATFVVIAPEHPIINQLEAVIESKRIVRIRKYISDTKSKSISDRTAEGKVKTGVFTGLYCVNQLTGYRMPLYISDFVLMEFGTGAVVGVPAHDERDYDFAKEFSLDSIKVVDYDNELHIYIDTQFVSDKLVNSISMANIYISKKKKYVGIVANRLQLESALEIVKNNLSRSGAYAQIDGYRKGIVTKEGIISDKIKIREFLKSYDIPENNIWLFNKLVYPFCYIGFGRMVNSAFLNGKTTEEAHVEIMDHIQNAGYGKKTSSFHLRDWLISRQRYWGPPIPMIYCQKCAKEGYSWFTSKDCIDYQRDMQSANKHADRLNKEIMATTIEESRGWYPVPENQLPVVLPRIDDYRPGDDGVAPLAKHKEFYETTCPGCGGKAVRETDVSDTFLDSSWYFLRYPSVTRNSAEVVSKNLDGSSVAARKSVKPAIVSNSLASEDALNFSHSSQNDVEQPFDPEITKKWLPVHMYTGGAEHSVLHLLYSRFVTMFLKDIGMIDFDEPFAKFFAHGLVIKDGAKMSKSKGNVVNPDEYISMYGADALRMYLMFMGPFSQGGDFRDTAMEGMSRWVGRLWRLAEQSMKLTAHIQKDHEEVIEKTLAKLIVKVSDDLEKRRYNTAIASMMEFTNLVSDQGGAVTTDQLRKFLIILSPFAPFVTEELWQMLHNRIADNIILQDSIHTQSWPTYNESYLHDDAVKFIFQVNGKLRELVNVSVSQAKSQEAMESIARKSEKMRQYIENLTCKKIIFVTGKLMNFVV